VKVSEKSLELNVGAEILGSVRNRHGMRKAYLRGLTQLEERQEGPDFFVHLDPQTRFLAFQFKAPKGGVDTLPYRYTLMRYQHDQLFNLATLSPNSVFYVFPFYVTPGKLHGHVPNLARDTWLLNVEQMLPAVFGGRQSKVVHCYPGRAVINPEYPLRPLREVGPSYEGVSKSEFMSWYLHLLDRLAKKRNPWVVRGLRVAIVLP